MYNYNFYISESPNKNGQHSIKLRYYENRHARVQIDTGIEIHPRFWNKEKSFLKKSKEVASEFVQLSQMDSLAEQIITTYKNQNRPLSKKLFKTQFEDGEPSINQTPVQDFFTEFDNYLEEKKGKVVKDVIKDYNSLKKHLEGFQEFSGIIINFNVFDYQFYQEWTDYLAYKAPLKTGGVGMKNNTIGKLVKNLKAFLNDRMRRNRIKPIDLSAFKVVQEEVDHIYLTDEEIQAIAIVDCEEDKELELVKDFFIIGCLTGLRFSDIKRIRPEYLDDNGFLNIRQKKTSGRIVVPLRKQVRDILEKYDGYSPDVDSFTFNRRIKELGDSAEIRQKVEIEHKRGTIKESQLLEKYKLISSHTCRRSFCTNAYLNGIDVQLIMKISGHKTEKAFRRYLKISNYEAAQKLKEAWGLD
ncbi:site-specific integrase [Flagellimonas onchidii]|uniref:site-specific integrase n=1 Tax=Flagellimonas onchidii TaxID=2562684 RepID=UPI001455E996|nr:site-specific integrase [Allomuricauda onchidii]